MDKNRSALVTGTTSGLGYEAAAQLANNGYGRIVVTGRNEARTAGAVAKLENSTGKKVFEPLALDLDSLASVERAAVELANRGGGFDTLILNAGIAPPADVSFTEDGFETTVASSLIGHHVLTQQIIEKQLLNQNARIVIAGSEAARGDVPTFNPVDLNELAADHFGGNLEAAIDKQLRLQDPATYKPGDVYATAKVFVAWWAAELARRLPEGTTVNAVSPGSTPDTNAINSAPFYMRKIMVPMFKLIPGMSHSVTDGAGRYLEVAQYGPDENGRFFASRPKKMTGPLERMEYPHISDRRAQAALWNVVTRATADVTDQAA